MEHWRIYVLISDDSLPFPLFSFSSPQLPLFFPYPALASWSSLWFSHFHTFLGYPLHFRQSKNTVTESCCQQNSINNCDMTHKMVFKSEVIRTDEEKIVHSTCAAILNQCLSLCQRDTKLHGMWILMISIHNEQVLHCTASLLNHQRLTPSVKYITQLLFTRNRYKSENEIIIIHGTKLN